MVLMVTEKEKKPDPRLLTRSAAPFTVIECPFFKANVSAAFATDTLALTP